MAREPRSVRSQRGKWAPYPEKILRVRSLHRASLRYEVLSVNGLHVNVRTVALLAASWPIRKRADRLLFVEVASVNGVDVQVRLHHMELAEVSATSAVGTDAHLRIVVLEVDVKQF